MSCCDHTCMQSRDCPIRAFHEAQETATPLNTENSDGSSEVQFNPPPLDWIDSYGVDSHSIVRALLLLYVLLSLGFYFFWR